MNCFGTILENFPKTPIQFWIKIMIMMSCIWGQICITERFRAGHFTCKNTDWEKWREPIRKVETRDYGLSPAHTDSSPDWALTFFDCSWALIDRSEDTQSGNFYFSVSFLPDFLSFLFHEDDQIYEFFPGSRRVSKFFICLFICSFLFACHAAVVIVLVAVVTGFVLKRLFASVATVCLEVGTSAV